MGNALGALTGDLVHGSLTKVGMRNTVAGNQLQVTVVTNLVRDAVSPLGFGLRSGFEGIPATLGGTPAAQFT